jgi:hypothetical protein
MELCAPYLSLVRHMGARWHCKGGRWHHMGAIHLQYVAHGSHMVDTALIWPSYIPCGSHMVPSVSHGVCRSHTAHMAPIQHMQLQSGTICLPPGAHSSHMASIWHMWFPYGACSPSMAPSASHMATSGSHMGATAPYSANQSINRTQ